MRSKEDKRKEVYQLIEIVLLVAIMLGVWL